jgi:hypothetical protein
LRHAETWMTVVGARISLRGSWRRAVTTAIPHDLSTPPPQNCLCVVEVPSVAARCFTQRLAELGSIVHDIRGYAGVPPPHTNNFGQVQVDY